MASKAAQLGEKGSSGGQQSQIQMLLLLVWVKFDDEICSFAKICGDPCRAPLDWVRARRGSLGVGLACLREEEE